jgi:hypothetical protein
MQFLQNHGYGIILFNKKQKFQRLLINHHLKRRGGGHESRPASPKNDIDKSESICTRWIS